MGQVCAKHNQFYETACRWCEPTAAVGLTAIAPDGYKVFFGIDPAPVLTFPAFTWMRIPVAVDPTLKAGERRFADNGNAAGPDLSESTLDRHGGCE